jgi:ribonuclease P protein component
LSFPRDHRLVTKAEFKRVFDESKKVNHRHVLILYSPNQKPHARIGIIVGKRFANSAVDRNRIRRVIRDSFRHVKDSLAGIDIVVIARSQCDTLSKATLRKGIDDLWKRLLTQHQKCSSG